MQTAQMATASSLLKQRWLRFVVIGVGNTLVSQGLLVLLLAIAPVAAATLISQLVHAWCGYLTSAKAVFGAGGSLWRYGVIVAGSWFVQWQALLMLLGAGIQRVWAVALLVPILAITSYWFQKHLVFR
ncbi:MAG: hypothetical protein FJ060_00825 [Cyanobacteria bacterium K_Offshore_0m_m2_072]|nr:hypothetical protein [Cyanobacteria bacterium K_Offshore_0m_m2_072]